MNSIQPFSIRYAGKDAQIEVDINPPVGKVFAILDRALKYKQGQEVPEIDDRAYLAALVDRLVVSAPWPRKGGVAEIEELDWETYSSVVSLLGTLFPLQRFLSPRVNLLYGQSLSDPQSPQQTESTILPSSTGSQKSRSTKNTTLKRSNG